MTTRYSFADLKTLAARLRDPADGCPWDIEQTYQSVTKHTLEEVYEVIDTIERQDYTHLREELGDLLFQIVLYAQIAQDEQRFCLDDVISDLVAKLIFRHPHVFPDGTLSSRVGQQVMQSAAVLEQWEQRKDEEKIHQKKPRRLLDDVPLPLTALLRAKKLQSRAARVGFDWPDVMGVLTKVDEEIAELKEALASENQGHIEEELGDALFALVNVARHSGLDPEQAMRAANRKFENRFNYIEERVLQAGKDWQACSLQELDDLWEQAKQLQKP